MIIQLHIFTGPRFVYKLQLNLTEKCSIIILHVLTDSKLKTFDIHVLYRRGLMYLHSDVASNFPWSTFYLKQKLNFKTDRSLIVPIIPLNWFVALRRSVLSLVQSKDNVTSFPESKSSGLLSEIVNHLDTSFKGPFRLPAVTTYCYFKVKVFKCQSKGHIQSHQKVTPMTTS